MNCPNCNQIVEDGAAFCGNCGHQLNVHAPDGKPVGSHIAQVLAHQHEEGATNFPGQTLATEGNVPNYAIATPSQHAGETKAVLAVVAGIAGIIGALFAPLMGIVLGVLGLIFGTLSFNSMHRRLSTVGIIFASLAVITSLGMWVYIINKQHTPQSISSSKAIDAVQAADVNTPCYATGFIETLNVSNTKNSCDMNAYNGQTLESSTKAYKVYSSQIAAVDLEAFNEFAKKAVQKDISTNLAGFTVESEGLTNFAGSPAYIAKTVDKSTGVAVTEAVVMHQVQAGSNIFVLVQASSKGGADMSTLEAQWQWK